jgi:hypothetical protein
MTLKFIKENYMKNRKMMVSLMFLLVGFSSVSGSTVRTAQEYVNELKNQAPKVFIDCGRCDMNYIKTEIPFVNYVRDRKEADVHVLITQQTTGAGGREYTIAFIGQNGFSDLSNTLVYVSNKTETSDEIRREYVRYLKLGLVPYAARTPICSLLGVSFRSKIQPTAVVDKWNFWVFSVSMNGRLNGEAQKSSKSIYGNISVNRVTPASKLRMGISANFDQRKYDYEDELVTSTSEMESFSGLYAKSINDHWSIGGFLNLSSSTYRNIHFSINPALAIEYNFFPYSQSTRRQLRFLYKLAHSYANYREETIFKKMSEHLFGQSLDITFEMKEPWGNVEASLEGSNYFHDFSKNRLEFDFELSLRIFKGLSLEIDGRYEVIHDQLSLPFGEATLEEILLRRKELATEYQYSLEVGLSFTFGSIYSNVVNPRFGEIRGGWRRFR